MSFTERRDEKREYSNKISYALNTNTHRICSPYILLGQGQELVKRTRQMHLSGIGCGDAGDDGSRVAIALSP